jgi:hypothetical protein
MEYTDRYNALKSILIPGESEIRIPDSGIKIRNTGFRSDLPLDGFMNENDLLIPENRSFSYPVFVPRNPGSRKVILLLHGLNERSWLKYLPWAYSLADYTDSYIILFPISFHINRSPESWRDPRLMVNLLKDRNASQGPVDKSSFANLALSNRLTEDPMRFFKSGYQTVEDIKKLVSDITEGKHPVVPGTANINIFAYSIGAFLAEIIMMGNPGKLFSESKLFIFSGGSVFSNMRGASKLIMDSRAFERVYNYFLNDFEGTITGKSPLVNFLRSSQLGMAFRSMIDIGRFKSFRENLLKKLQDQIHTIALARDAIIPPGGTIATLGRFPDKDNLKVWDFQYDYTHENPFPVIGSPLSRKVDYWFERVFSEASLFLG